MCKKRSIFRGDKQFWAPIAISSGLTIMFFGIPFTTISRWAGWVDIVFGIILLGIGFLIAPKR
ncbi:MAG: hypothetical protein COS87_03960 [Chloroflexi bacterium CG07_land_8_20_14_0_80_45_17]|nr:MAG: hypothetical protein COS87_03960 [Chloroflexi bacterium CG07_land_8_20_14_0_80_45_17]